MFESDVCLTYCVPLVDSLCSSVRVTHVSGVACVFRKEGDLCVRVCVDGRARVRVAKFSGSACVCMNALKKNLFIKKFYRRKFAGEEKQRRE